MIAGVPLHLAADAEADEALLKGLQAVERAQKRRPVKSWGAARLSLVPPLA